MANDKLPAPLQGIVTPLVTPLTGDRETLDSQGLERLIEHVLAGGVHALMILGTTGEGAGLSYKVRMQVIEQVGGQVGGRVPVLVCVSDTSFGESVSLAEHAADNAANAVVVAAPYYFAAEQSELLEYVEHIAGRLPLPLFLYNLPSHTKVNFEVDTIRRVLDVPNVVGLKDSSGSMTYFHEVLQVIEARPGFSLLAGPEQLLADAVLLGGHGGVNGGSNLAPELYVKLYNAAAAGELDRVRALHSRVMDVAAKLYTLSRGGSAYLKGIKCALSVLGVCDDHMAEPLQRLGQAERSQIERRLGELGIGARVGT